MRRRANAGPSPERPIERRRMRGRCGAKQIRSSGAGKADRIGNIWNVSRYGRKQPPKRARVSRYGRKQPPWRARPSRRTAGLRGKRKKRRGNAHGRQRRSLRKRFRRNAAWRHTRRRRRGGRSGRWRLRSSATPGGSKPRWLDRHWRRGDSARRLGTSVRRWGPSRRRNESQGLKTPLTGRSRTDREGVGDTPQGGRQATSSRRHSGTGYSRASAPALGVVT
mmetsp:Transcript_22371/g.53674  ORF Transcript_22371/g.53674 Transcript_22371/m.53674 type:complete len:222 (-) Transcript_22371:131-796(-)